MKEKIEMALQEIRAMPRLVAYFGDELCPMIKPLIIISQPAGRSSWVINVDITLKSREGKEKAYLSPLVGSWIQHRTASIIVAVEWSNLREYIDRNFASALERMRAVGLFEETEIPEGLQ